MRISILGCGWLGLPLAEHLIGRNHVIKGSTTTKSKIQELKSSSIEPYLIELTPELSADDSTDSFWNSDVLVLNVPPGRGSDNIIDYHTRQIQAVIHEVIGSPIKHVIFISSTSVYPKNPGLVTEADAIPGKAGRDSGNALLKAENLLFERDEFETTVLRFGGLYGGDRHPIKYLAGRKDLGRASASVNLIHRDDCIAIITRIIEEQITGEVFNAVADGHLTRKEYYTKAAEVMGLEPPIFKEEERNKDYKIVSNEKLKKALNYRFKFANPMDGLG